MMTTLFQFQTGSRGTAAAEDPPPLIVPSGQFRIDSFFDVD